MHWRTTTTIQLLAASTTLELTQLTHAQRFPLPSNTTTTTSAPLPIQTPWNVTHYGGTVNLTNHLALTPPMGWSSWNHYGPDINESVILSTIDAMERLGLKDAGYTYVNIDDGWQRYKGSRADHPLEVDPVKFPNGIKGVADYAHARGFKLGIYSGPGVDTCAGFTGSEGHVGEDARVFAEWGVDHLKYDSCCSHA